MSTFSLMLRELRLRWMNFLLALLAVAAAGTLVVSLTAMGRASNVETKRLMRNLGFNLVILPGAADLAAYWGADQIRGEMPEEYVHRLAQTRGIGADHYVGTLQQKLHWRGLEVLLTGVLPERNAVDAPGKEPMGYEIPRGKCYVGFAIAQALKLSEGDALDVEGVPLKVERCLVEDGSREDARLYCHLADAQRIAGMPGRINMIQALGCLCAGGPLALYRDRIGKVLPDTYVTELRNIAIARSETRSMVERNVESIVAAVIGVCALWVALLAWLNVRERRQEIGILRALGFDSTRLALLFLGRAVLIGIMGALLGFAAGTGISMHYGAEAFALNFAKVKPAVDLLPRLLIGAVGVSVLACLLPTMTAVTQDPAATLTEE